MKKKKIYLIGNDESFLGYTYDKEFFKFFKEKRKGFKYKILKNDSRAKEIIERFHPYEEIVEMFGVPVLPEEENYFIEAMDQFINSMKYSYLPELKNYISKIKFTKEEKKILFKAIDILVESCVDIENIVYDCDEYYNGRIDCEKAMQFFIKEVLNEK